MNELVRLSAARRMSRRGFGAGAFGLGLAGAGFRVGARAQDASTPDGETGDAHLFVADAAEAKIYLYSMATNELTGQLDGVTFGGHNGLFVLPDGRLIFSDDVSGELLAVTIDAGGGLSIAQRTPITVGEIIAWSSFDPGLRYAAAASLIPDSDTQVVNLVDLETFTNTELTVTMVGDEELHTWLIGDPLHLHVALGGQIDSYLVADVLAGEAVPVGSVQVELGSHGGVTDTVRNRIVLTAFPGFEVLDVSGGAAVHQTNLPWDVDDLTGGRNGRPRLGWDGDHIFGVLTKPVDAPENWADAEVSVHIADLADDSVARVLVGAGRFAGRWGLGETAALLAGYGADGGAAYVFNVDPADAAFGTVTATIPLDLPTGAATAGEAPQSGVQGYATAITLDGSTGAVAYGGDGRIDVIDLVEGAVTSTIETPTPLTNAGYIAVVEPGRTPVDLWGR